MRAKTDSSTTLNANAVAQKVKKIKANREAFVSRIHSCDTLVELLEVQAEFKALCTAEAGFIQGLSGPRQADIKALDDRVILVHGITYESFLYEILSDARQSSIAQIQTATSQSALGEVRFNHGQNVNMNIPDMQKLTSVHFRAISSLNTQIDALIKEKQAEFDAVSALSALANIQHEERLAELRPILQQLTQLTDKSFKAKNDPSSDAKTAMNKAHGQLKAMVDDYLQGAKSRDEFKQTAKDYFDSSPAEVQTLKQHRGIKQILTNILTAILTLGVGYAIGAACKHTWNFFPVATDSAKKVDALRNSIENLPASPVLNGAV